MSTQGCGLNACACKPKALKRTSFLGWSVKVKGCLLDPKALLNTINYATSRDRVRVLKTSGGSNGWGGASSIFYSIEPQSQGKKFRTSAVFGSKIPGASRAGRRETVELKTFLFSRALTTACNQREAIPQRHRASAV